MSDANKNIQITPSTNGTNEPLIQFTGADDNTVTLRVLDDGTLSFEGSVGQLFSISDSISGTLFSVNDVAGVPAIEVDDTGTVKLAEFGGNVRIGSNINIDSSGNILINNENVIPEFGSNANGSFTKFPDGTLMCRRVDSFETNLSLGLVVDGQAFNNISLSFPAAFVTTPTVINASYSINRLVNTGVASISTASVTLRTQATNTGTYAINLGYLAIGRWK
jgi:hypothetical protein